MPQDCSVPARKFRSSRSVPKPIFEKATKDAVPDVQTPDLQMPPFGPELHAQKANSNNMISISPAPNSAFMIAHHPDQNTVGLSVSIRESQRTS